MGYMRSQKDKDEEFDFENLPEGVYNFSGQEGFVKVEVDKNGFQSWNLDNWFGSLDPDENQEQRHKIIQDIKSRLNPDSGLIRSDTLANVNLQERNLKDFSTQYPAFFRMGISKLIEDQALISMDMTTGFSNSFNGYTNWKFALGTEIFRFKNVIYRLGYTFGGNNFSDLSYGMGYVIGPFFGSKIELDIAFSLKNSIFINRAQGLDFALGIIWSR